MDGWEDHPTPQAAVPAGHRRVALPGGAALTVRPVVPADAAAVGLLYEGLSLDDRYARFFSAYRPTGAFIARLVGTAERGGAGLVAVVAGPGGPGRIVGEASYSLLADGDGDFAITVARDWRGWLGPFLLDALLEAAAARNVPNLRADILRENREMLALVRSRGYAAVDHVGYQVVRVVLATRGRVPSWPAAHAGPRVLVEVPGAHWHAEEAAQAAGLTVMSCPGPEPGSGARCPVPAGGECPLAAGADVVVCSLPPQLDRSARVLAAHRRRGVPVCAEPTNRTARTGYEGGGVDAVVGPGADADTVVAVVLSLVPRTVASGAGS